MSEADSRPRPQYGEYATPEEQRARIVRPDITDALHSGMQPAATPSPAPASASAAMTAERPSGWRLADRMITIALLVYGLVNMLFTVPRLFDFTNTADEYLALLGVQEPFTNVAAAQVWGPLAGGAYLLGFVVTALFAWRGLRRGRAAFWIPLVGAFATLTLVAVCLTVPLASDPAFLGFVGTFSGR